MNKNKTGFYIGKMILYVGYLEIFRTFKSKGFQTIRLLLSDGLELWVVYLTHVEGKITRYTLYNINKTRPMTSCCYVIVHSKKT